MKSLEQNKIYFNQKQLRFLLASQKTKAFIAGRGTGKTTVIGERQYRCASQMPGGKGFLSSTTYAQILTKSLPEMQAVWSRHGLIEDFHYVVGRKPPKGFVKPIKQVKRFDNVVSFGNGYHIEFLSMDRPDIVRGGSYDGGDIDEAALVKKEAFTRVIIPSVRGNRHFFKHVPEHQQICLYSSIPWKPSGYWILDYEEKAKNNPDRYFWQEACTMDNVAILGLETIARMKDELPWLEYQVEVLNRRIRKIPDGFYHKYDPDKHNEIATFNYGLGPKGITLEGEKDLNPKSLIDFTLDFGGKINCGLAIQFRKNTINVLREFYVKDDQKIRELVNAFCDHYKDHKCKYVRLWGEPRGNDRQPDGEPHFIRMQGYFQQRGWQSEVRATKTAESHLSRHNFLTEIFEEQNPTFPRVRINENHCKNFVIVLQTTGINDDFKKDKSKERDSNFPQEQAPHLSDAFDNFCTQCFPHLLNSDGTFWIPNSFSYL